MIDSTAFHGFVNSLSNLFPGCIKCVIQHDLQVLPLGACEIIVNLFVVENEAVLSLDFVYLMEVVTFVKVFVVQELVIHLF